MVLSIDVKFNIKIFWNSLFKCKKTAMEPRFQQIAYHFGCWLLSLFSDETRNQKKERDGKRRIHSEWKEFGKEQIIWKRKKRKEMEKQKKSKKGKKRKGEKRREKMWPKKRKNKGHKPHSKIDRGSFRWFKVDLTASPPALSERKSFLINSCRLLCNVISKKKEINK